MSNHSRRPSQAEVGDSTERNEVPHALRYPTRAPAMPAPQARARHQSNAPMTLDPEPALARAPMPKLDRKPKATPAPLDDANRSNVLPFMRPAQQKAMVVATTSKQGMAAAPEISVTRPRSKSQVHAAVVVSQPQGPGLPPQVTAAAVFSSPMGPQVAVAMPQAHSVYPPASAAAAPLLAPLAPPAVVHDVQAHAVQEHKPWAAYEKLGLGEAALQKVHQKTSKLVVSAYRVMGFLILTIIVLLLVGYITESIFYFISDSWVQPMVVSKGDDKLVQMASALAQQQNNRDRIASDLTQAEQAIARQQEFQGQFMNTVKADYAGRKLMLAKLRGIAGQYASAGASVTGTNASYAANERARRQKEYAAGLIDRNAMLAVNFSGAQITTSTLGIQEKRVETEQRADELANQVSSLEAILSDKPDATNGILSYDILKIKQEYDNSRLELSKAVSTRDALKSSLAREDEIIKAESGESYLRALKDNASVAFVPYANMKAIKEGASLYGCKLGMFACHKVGQVIQVLPGEIQQKHPHRDKMLRGQLVEVTIEDGAAAQDDVLFVGGKPLLF